MVISIHALREEGDTKTQEVYTMTNISIHALREEGDDPLPSGQGVYCYFYPRPPRGGRPYHPHMHLLLCVFLSTPSARRATHPAQLVWLAQSISIHALREEGDSVDGEWIPSASLFLSTPSARRATSCEIQRPDDGTFLSTPSARRATAKTEKNISAFVSL